MVEFISYTGKYPKLCDGIATFKIDGYIITFNNERLNEDGELIHYPRFWKSGGWIPKKNNHSKIPYKSAYVLDDWWIKCPDAPIFILNNINECLKLFNQNVEHGCCGGCY